MHIAFDAIDGLFCLYAVGRAALSKIHDAVSPPDRRAMVTIVFFHLHPYIVIKTTRVCASKRVC